MRARALRSARRASALSFSLRERSDAAPRGARERAPSPPFFPRRYAPLNTFSLELATFEPPPVRVLAPSDVVRGVVGAGAVERFRVALAPPPRALDAAATRAAAAGTHLRLELRWRLGDEGEREPEPSAPTPHATDDEWERAAAEEAARADGPNAAARADPDLKPPSWGAWSASGLARGVDVDDELGDGRGVAPATTAPVLLLAAAAPTGGCLYPCPEFHAWRASPRAPGALARAVLDVEAWRRNELGATCHVSLVGRAIEDERAAFVEAEARAARAAGTAPPSAGAEVARRADEAFAAASAEVDAAARPAHYELRLLEVGRAPRARERESERARDGEGPLSALPGYPLRATRGLARRCARSTVSRPSCGGRTRPSARCSIGSTARPSRSAIATCRRRRRRRRRPRTPRAPTAPTRSRTARA